jgi:hypothetical protein
VASSPSDSRWGRADAIFEAVLELPARERSAVIAERERCDEASRPMVDAALAEIVHDRRPG